MKTAIKGLLLIASLLQTACNSTEPGEQFRLSVEDVSCTEVWLKVEGASSNEIKLERDGSEIKNFKLFEGNIIYDDSLQPNTTYTYKASLTNKDVTAKEAIATTLDTTSSNFTWEKFYFGGEKGSCYFKDVAIIDENNIWCVGDITLSDTNENGFTPYNVAHWNGKDWELLTLKHNCRLYHPNCIGDLLYTPAYSVFVLSADNIWISSGGVHHYDGNKWTEEAGIYGAGGAKKIWGTEEALWFVGGDGFIACRRSDGSWNKIESGTELDIQDIYGTYNEKTKQYEILAVCSKIFQSLDREIIKISKNSVEHLSNQPITGTLRTVWFLSNQKYYVGGGSGIFYKRLYNDALWISESREITSYTINRIRGTNINDIIAAGGVGEVLHFNGHRWKSYFEKTGLETGNYYGLDFNHNIIVVVGHNNPQAIVTIGRR